MPRDGYYFDDVAFNTPGATIDPAAFRPVTGFTDEQLRAMEARGKFLYENTEYAMLGWGGGVCFLGLSLITDRLSNVTMGLPSEWMIMLMTEKETCHEMMDRSVEASIKCLEQLHDAVGDRCFAWGIAADDSGTQRGEFIRPGAVGRDDQAALRQAVRLDSPQHEVEDVPALLRLDLPPDSAHDRGGRRHPESHPDLRGQHAARAAEGGVRRQDRLLGRRVRHPAASCPRQRRRRSASTSGSGWPSSSPAADTSSTRFTTSSPTSPPRTSSPCWTPRTNTVDRAHNVLTHSVPRMKRRQE